MIECILFSIISMTYYFFIFGLFLWLLKELTMGIYRPQVSMKGKVVVVTGGNSGIGLESAIDLARKGAKVVLGCRNKERGEKAVKVIKEKSGSDQVVVRHLDHQNLDSVRKFAETVSREEDKVYVLLNNAGMSDGQGFKSDRTVKSYFTKDNPEIVTQTNHLSHFLLTNLLKESLARAGNARVINVSSLANLGGKIDVNNINYESNHDPEILEKNYHNSRLMNVMFSIEISRRWSELGITSYSCHPGLVRSNIFDSLSGTMSETRRQVLIGIAYLLGKNNWQGAQTSIYLCVQPEIEKMAGEFFVDCRSTQYYCNKQTKDDQICNKLWLRSEELVGLS